jgi:hypothetical protein
MKEQIIEILSGLRPEFDFNQDYASDNAYPETNRRALHLLYATKSWALWQKICIVEICHHSAFWN